MDVEFQKTNARSPGDYRLNKIELEHIRQMYTAILNGFESGIEKSGKRSRETDIYYAMWIPDSDTQITKFSVKTLNTAKHCKAFLKEFG